MSEKIPFRSILQREFLTSQVHSLKPHAAICIDETSSVKRCLEILVERKVGSVIISGLDGSLVGIFTDRDAVKYLDPGRPFPLLRDVMTVDPQTVRYNSSIARALFLMAEGRYRHLPIEPRQGEPLSIISIKDIFDRIHRRLTSKLLESSDQIHFEQNSVDAFFASEAGILKPTPPVALSAQATVGQALGVLREVEHGAVLITSPSGKPIGIFTERDYVSRVLIDDSRGVDTPITAVMTPSPHTVFEETSVAFIFNLLSENGFRHLPLVDENEAAVGMLSVRVIADFLAHSIIDAIETYKQS